jgi:hypothetical protein
LLLLLLFAAAAAARLRRVLVAIPSPTSIGLGCCFAAARPLRAPLRSTGIVHPS